MVEEEDITPHALDGRIFIHYGVIFKLGVKDCSVPNKSVKVRRTPVGNVPDEVRYRRPHAALNVDLGHLISVVY